MDGWNDGWDVDWLVCIVAWALFAAAIVVEVWA